MEILRRRKADRLTGNYPTDPNVAAFLSGIGFFRLLAIRPPRGARGIGACGRLIKLASNNKISEQDTETIVEMALSSSVTLWPRARFRMFAAMGEAMLNVQYHAYDPAFPRSTPVLDGRWWKAVFR